jgi:RNA polymerase sigma factor (sigma-70 family)
VWLDVARRIAQFRGSEPEFRSWLFTLARRRVIDRRRYETRHPELPTADFERLDHPAADDTAAKALEVISTENALALIATLPRDQAEIIVLRVVAGLDTAQVARIVGKSTGAVRVAAHRGLRVLTDRLGGGTPVTPDPVAKPPRAKTRAPGKKGVTLCAPLTVSSLRCRSFPFSARVALPGGHPMTRSRSDCWQAMTRVPMPRLPSTPWR